MEQVEEEPVEEQEEVAQEEPVEEQEEVAQEEPVAEQEEVTKEEPTEEQEEVSQEELVQEQEEVVQEDIKVDVLSTEPYKENKEHNKSDYSVEEPIENINVDYNAEPELPILSVSESDNDAEDTVVYKSYKDFDSVSFYLIVQKNIL